MLGLAVTACPTESYPQARTSYYTSLHDALVYFQNSWGVDLVYDASLVESKWTAWNKPEAGDAFSDLEFLLAGSGLVAFRLQSGTFGLKAAPSRFGSVSGTVLDAYTRLPLQRASIQIKGTPSGVATDEQGRFSLPGVLAGRLTLRISYLGYTTRVDSLLVIPGSHRSLEIALRPEPIEYQPLDVWAVVLSFEPEIRVMNQVEGSELDQVGGIGTVDVWRNVNEDVAGIGLDARSSDLHIQGGSPGEHQFTLDGSNVFHPVFVSGLFGGFNAFALDNIVVHKAGFGASQGSYQAGVVRAEHSIADTTNSPLQAYFDPLSFNTRVNLAFENGGVRGSAMGALRTSIWNGWWSGIRSPNVNRLLLNWNEPDVFLLRASQFPLKKLRPDLYKAFTELLSNIPPPSLPNIAFYDLHLAGKLFFDRGTFHGSYYRGDSKLQGRHLIAQLLVDDESIPRPDAYDWFNEAGQITWTFLQSANLLLHSRIRGSRYRLRHKYAGLDRDDAFVLPVGNRLFIDVTPAEDGNQIQEIAMQQVLELDHGAGFLTASLEYLASSHRFVVRDIFPNGIRHSRMSTSMVLFLEEELQAAPWLAITAGTRLTYLQARRAYFLEPRLALQTKVRTDQGIMWFGRLAGGLYYQFLNQFDVSTISPSTLISSKRVWLPVDESLAPPKSYHLAADLGLTFADYWTLRVEGYYKIQPRVFRIDYPQLWLPDSDGSFDEPVRDLTSQSEFVAHAKGFAYGVAPILERESESLRLHARYEYNVSEREYAFRGNNIRMLPVPWSEPHRLYLAADATLLSRFAASARWSGIWGRTWGFRQAYYDYLAADTRQGLTFGGVDFREPISAQHRLSPLTQLDLGLTYETRIRESAIQLRVNLLNVLNRRNQAELYLEEVAEPPPGSDQPPVDALLIQTKYQIGRTLSLALQLRW